MTDKTLKTRFLPSALPVALVMGSVVAVQGVNAQSDQPPGSGLEEIIVTAQKREQSINDVGMSINAISGAALSDMGITSTADLSKIVPALSVTPPGSGITGAPVYTLRGIGFNEKSLAALSAVSFYVDEVPLPYVYMTAGPSLDIQRVEVLKGPQGTLYGQNSTAGTINYIANRPTETFDAGVEASYGRFNRFDWSGHVSGPLTETLKARVAVRGITADGWQKSQSRPGDELGAVESYAARILLDWAPADSLRFELNLNGWVDRSESPGVQIVGFNPVLYPAGAALLNPVSYGNYAALFTNARVQPDDQRLTDWTLGFDYENDNEFGQAALRTEWDLAANVRLTAITAYSHFEYDTYHDIDASAAMLNSYSAAGDINAFSQELRLSGNALDRLDWIVGANYADDRISDSNVAWFAGSTLGFFRNGTTGTTALGESERESKAAFASADFKLTPAVTLTGGVRYTDVDLDFSGCAADPGNGLISQLVTGSTLYTGQCVTRLVVTAPGTFGRVYRNLAESNVSWRGGVNWKPTDDQLLYANVSRGYKSGNIPTLTGSLEFQYAPVKQEQVTAYEVGFKSTLLDGALQLNGAAYHMDYKDKQLYAFIFNPLFQSNSELTVNIPKSEVNGAELQVVSRPIEGLTLSAGVGYTDTEIKESPSNVFFVNTTTVWPPAPGFANSAPGDLTGQPFNLAPEWQGNVDGMYRWPVTSSLEALVGATLVYSSDTLPTIGASSNMKLPSYTTLDLRAGVESSSGRWRALLWGRNVTDEEYLTGVIRGFDVTSRFTAMPATYGITLGYNFD